MNRRLEWENQSADGNIAPIAIKTDFSGWPWLLLWAVSWLGCASVPRPPNQRLADQINAAPAGSFQKGIPPPEQDGQCTVATAQECFQRAQSVLGQSSDLETKLRALSLLSQACDGQVREACDEVGRHLVGPEIGRVKEYQLQNAVRPFPRFVRIRCRVVDTGELKGCAVTSGEMSPAAANAFLRAVQPWRLGTAALDGTPVEVDYYLNLDGR